MLFRTKHHNAIRLGYLFVAALLSVLLVTSISNAFDDTDIAKVAGNTYGELAAKWSQWAFDTEFAQFGDGDVDCYEGQRGAVWFLAGSFAGVPVERTCLASIPAGKRLFFPLVNFIFYNPDASCPEADGNCTVAEKRENANGFFSDQIPGNLGGALETYACQLSATVDGVPVQIMGYPIVRTQSPEYPLEQVNDLQTIDDGYYVALPPLGEGEHTIRFTGGICDFEQSPGDVARDGGPSVFSVDVTYDLTVQPDDD